MNPFSRLTSWIIWLVLMVFYLYMGGVVMSKASEDIQKSSTDAGCAKPLDLNVAGITLETAHHTLTCMGIQGRRVYRKIEVQQDYIYPFAYGLLLVFTLLALSSYCLKNKAIILSVSGLPLIVIAADFLENHYIIKLISEFPDLNDSTVTSLSVFNGLKWILFFVAAGLIILFVFLSLIKLYGRKAKVA